MIDLSKRIKRLLLDAKNGNYVTPNKKGKVENQDFSDITEETILACSNQKYIK